MHDQREILEDHVTRMLESRIRPASCRERLPCTVRAFQVADRFFPVEAAMASESFRPFERGTPWGAPWQTTWLEITAKVPPGWRGERVELHVDLGFSSRSPGFQAEGLAYGRDGAILKGIAPDNNWLSVADRAEGGESVLVYVEAAANPTFMSGRSTPEPSALGDPATAGTTPLYTFAGADLVAVDDEVMALALDIEVLDGLMRELPTDEPRRHEILQALVRALDVVDPSEVPSGAAAARALLTPVLARPASATAHRCSAVGHAHIDSAWLWPVEETVRKCARSFANVVDLMDRYPELVFACSQAQQYEWIKQCYPGLYERIKKKVTSGRWLPTGAMWVEADTNLPGGEALARQIIYGQRFFLAEFGIESGEVWLPDCFGYSGALPQLMRLAGIRYFMTQKMSWNQTNRFPHHSFYWEGIDGSRVFAHFPPVETYHARVTPAELAHAVHTYAEHGHGTRSLVPFGHGDGGGGPTREMVERARRLADLEGSARLQIESPGAFFAAAEAEYSDAPVWSGEMYLEMHRGTYTSQAGIKKGNRFSEHLLREAELWSATAATTGVGDYPYEELESIWKLVLLNQFHDIIPGSSIAQVNQEALASYASIAKRLELLVERAQSALVGEGSDEVVFNAAPHSRQGVAALGAGPLPAPSGPPVSAGPRPGGGFVLDNGILRAEIDARGLLVSVVDLAAAREAIVPGHSGNLLQLHRDLPNRWDAWDVDPFYRNSVEDVDGVESLELLESGGAAASVVVTRLFGSSRATQVVTLERDAPRLEIGVTVDWRERERFLKLAFPLDVEARQSCTEIQFGHVERPSHTNTSWDDARFETSGHRFVHVAEHGYGIAMANDSVYGHDVHRIARPGGGWGTNLRFSLLRGPRFPDPNADEGVHEFHLTLVPGATTQDAVVEGYRANLRLRRRQGSRIVEPLVEIDNPAVVVEAVKLADDRSGDVVLRLYEALGGRARALCTARVALAGAHICDLLERPLRELSVESASVALDLRPFEILTVRLVPARAGSGHDGVEVGTGAGGQL
jgi:alpha-mannosidase